MAFIFQSFALAFGLSVVLVPMCRVVARRFAVVAHPRDDRWHRETVPLLGGLAIALSVLAGTLVTGVARDVGAPLGAALLICVVGVVDDVLSLKPATKLIAQIALASLLVYAGYRLNWLDSRLLDSLVTIVWLVGLTNAFNLLDNMDGLCAGIALIVAVMLIVGLYSGVTRLQAGSQITMLALLAGATAGFLIYNFPPASIFMGDGGSLLLGFSLAALTLSPEGVRGSRSDVLSVITAPVFVLLIPIFDTSLVTALRLLSGRSPARGGRDHSSHRLVAIGLSERTAILVLCFLAAVGGAIGTLLRQAEAWSVPVAALFILMLCLFAVYLARIKVYDDPVLATTAGRAVTPLVATFLYRRRVAEVLLDFYLIILAYYAAYHLRFESDEYLRNVEAFYQSVTVVLAVQLVSFFIVGVYRGVWRHFALIDGVTIGKGVVLGTAAIQLVVLIIYPSQSYSHTVFVIYALLVGLLVTVSRASFRLMGEFVQRLGNSSRRAVIYGAGENAALVVRELSDRPKGSLKVLGFVDDDPRIARMRVQGYPILGTYDALIALIEARALDVVVINHVLEDDRLTTLEALCQNRGMTLLRLQVRIEELVSADGPSPAARLRAGLHKAGG